VHAWPPPPVPFVPHRQPRWRADPRHPLKSLNNYSYPKVVELLLYCMRMTRRHLFAILVLSVAPLSALAGCTSPTLPLPPPNALSSAPEDGFVTLTGNGAIAGAVVIGFNENTGQGRLTTASDAGEFTLRIMASSGDSLLVWQRTGAQSGEQTQVIVPEASSP